MISVCLCNQTLHIYMCKPIVGYRIFIYRVYLYLLLLAVAFYPTIGVGSFQIHFLVPLWSGYYKSRLLPLYCWFFDYLGEPAGNWYPWLVWPFLTLLIIICSWCDPRLIPHIFNSVVSYVKACIISLSFFLCSCQNCIAIIYIFYIDLFISFIGCDW